MNFSQAMNPGFIILTAIIESIRDLDEEHGMGSDS
jgi:hypothetical protein